MAKNLMLLLPDDLSRALDEAAEQAQRDRMEIVLLALNQYLRIPPQREDAPAARVQHLIGSLESGIPDLAEDHRTYLLDSIAQKHGR
jgi:hypothetical protein